MIPVVDVSKWQGLIDFRKMKSRGVQGVIVRLGNGVALDTMARTYVDDARAAELVVGGYWFMNPKATATGAEQGRRLVERARQLRALDIPPMLDIESYTAEPGSFPVLRGQPLLNWQCDAAQMVRQMLGYSPIVYTNKAYTDSVGWASVGDLGRCPLIVARYPWYFEGNPQPPDDATKWESWLYANTTKRPQVPAGFDGWQGWQFSAGFNRRGATFGASSSDLDLNLIRADAWASWLGVGSPAPAREDLLFAPAQPDSVIAPAAPAVQPIIVNIEGDDVPQFIAQSPTKGRALVTPKYAANNQGAFLMSGIEDDDDFAVLTIDAELKVVDWPDEVYLIRAERSRRLFGVK